VSEQFNIDRVQGLNLGLSAGAVALSWLLLSPLFAASLAAGAVIEAANFRSLRRSCQRMFQSGVSGGSGVRAAGIFSLRFAMLGAAIGISLYAGVHPVGLSIGLSMIVPSVVIAAWMARPEPVPATAAPPPDDPSWDDWNPWLAREREPDAEEDQ
jgi:hypothetical protein